MLQQCHRFVAIMHASKDFDVCENRMQSKFKWSAGEATVTMQLLTKRVTVAGFKVGWPAALLMHVLHVRG